MKNREAAGPAPSPSPVTKRNSAPDIISVLLIYAISGIGFLVIGGMVFSAEPSNLSLTSPVLLLGVLPLATLVILGIQLQRLIKNAFRRRYGARLRVKLVVICAGLVMVASLPQALLSLRIVRLVGERLGSAETSLGASEGLRLLLAYNAADTARLEAIAQNELPRLLPRTRDPSLLLAGLRAIEPRMEAVEIFENKKPSRSAGPLEARLATPPQAGITGALPAETREGVSRIRQAVTRDDAVIVLCLRLPEGLAEATAAMAAASSAAAALSRSAAGWPGYMALMYGLFVLPLFLLALLLAIAAANFVSEPLAGLEDATKRIASGDFTLRLLAKPGDERGWLIASFNRMLDEMARWREGDLMQERIDAWKDIAQRLAHELKNPLTPIRLASERLLRTARNNPSRVLEIIEDSTLAIIAEVDGMDNLLGDFRALASLPSPERELQSLSELIEDSIAVYRASYPEVVFIVSSLPPELKLYVDRSMIKRALGNLLANAIEAMAGRGKIVIGADLVKTGDSGYCRLRLSDTGRGISDENRDKIFMPYFTTRETGTGLGLAIVERIVHDHGGRIRFESAEGIGTVFWIDLPIER